MKQISKEQFNKLKEAGLIRYGMNKNYQITSKKKKSRRKKYYVAEAKPILLFLDKLERQ